MIYKKRVAKKRINDVKCPKPLYAPLCAEFSGAELSIGVPFARCVMNNLLQRHPELGSGAINLTDCHVGLCPSRNYEGRVVALSKAPRRPRATLGDPVSLVDSRTTCENDGKLEVLRQVPKHFPLFHTAFDMKGGKLCCQ